MGRDFREELHTILHRITFHAEDLTSFSLNSSIVDTKIHLQLVEVKFMWKKSVRPVGKYSKKRFFNELKIEFLVKRFSCT